MYRPGTTPKITKKGIVMPEQPHARFYAYSLALGRRRVPAEYSHTEAAAVVWAELRGADNVVLEEGSPSAPVSVRFIWKRELS
jgi:hypothetical protein